MKPKVEVVTNEFLRGLFLSQGILYDRIGNSANINVLGRSYTRTFFLMKEGRNDPTMELLLSDTVGHRDDGS